MKRLRGDSGLGLTEVIIAMLLLFIIMLSMLTVLITAMRTVAANSTRATAAEAVQARIEQARTAAVSGDCAVVAAVVTPSEVVTDGRGIAITLTGTVANCDQSGVSDPHDLPQLARVTVTATTAAAGFPSPSLATTATDIFVKFDPS